MSSEIASLRGGDSITLRVIGTSRTARVVIETWGIRQGRYGSIGHVSVPAPLVTEVGSLEDLAGVILTALYGLDYDL